MRRPFFDAAPVALRPLEDVVLDDARLERDWLLRATDELLDRQSSRIHVRPICTTRKYGPYVGAVFTARTYGCIFDNRTYGPYVRAVFTGALFDTPHTGRTTGVKNALVYKGRIYG